MTDAELQGMPAQAFNMAKLDLQRRDRVFNFLLASYFAGEGLRRMRKVEALIIEKLGERWLDSGHTKDMGFGLLKTCATLTPHAPDAIVLATIINKFEPTEKMLALPAEEQYRLANETSHATHHQMVKEGLFTIHDALMCCAQNPQRVCLYTQKYGKRMGVLGPIGKPEVSFLDQDAFGGRLKMYGEDKSFHARNSHSRTTIM